jgi:hypothetical protein
MTTRWKSLRNREKIHLWQKLITHRIVISVSFTNVHNSHFLLDLHAPVETNSQHYLDSELSDENDDVKAINRTVSLSQQLLNKSQILVHHFRRRTRLPPSVYWQRKLSGSV